MLFAIRHLRIAGGCALLLCNSTGMRVDLLQVIIEAVKRPPEQPSCASLFSSRAQHIATPGTHLPAQPLGQRPYRALTSNSVISTSARLYFGVEAQMFNNHLISHYCTFTIAIRLTATFQIRRTAPFLVRLIFNSVVCHPAHFAQLKMIALYYIAGVYWQI